MPKLKVITSKKIIIILQKNGFEIDHVTGSHYIFYNKINKKRVTIPFHGKDIAKGTLLSIIRSAGLSKDDFRS